MQYHFDNGYGATVHRDPGRYLWKIGVTSTPGDEILENTPAFRGTIKDHLLWEDIEKYLQVIHDLESRQ